MKQSSDKYTKLHPSIPTIESAADVLDLSLGKARAVVVGEREIGDAVAAVRASSMARTVKDVDPSACKNCRGTLSPCLPLDDLVDEADDVSVCSNPYRWNNNFAKKMQDMQLHFSCGPLRVSKCCTPHWERLHAAHKTLLPLPGGQLELIKQQIPHTSDAELVEKIQQSGIGKHRKTPAEVEACRQVESPLPKRTVTTPTLEFMLRANYVPPLPKKVSPNDPFRALERRKKLIAGLPLSQSIASNVESKDCDSVFSTTTVGSLKLQPPATAKVDACSNVSVGGIVASHGPAKEVLNLTADDGERSTISTLYFPKESLGPSSNVSSRVEKLRSDIDREKKLSTLAMDHIRAASRQLDDLERILNGR